MPPEFLKPSCPQCGGDVPVPEGATYAHCPYCDSESFVDLSGALLYQVIKPMVGHPRAYRLLQAAAQDAGWSGVQIADLALIYEPVWELELSDGRRLRIGARPAPDGRFGLVDLPGGERGFVKQEKRDRAASWLEPELAPESLPEVGARLSGRPVRVHAIRLVHHPIFSGQATIQGVQYELRLDAVSGAVLAASWPVQPTYHARNQAWMATFIMILAAAAIPLPWSALAVLAVGAFAIRSLMRPGTALARSAT